MVTSGTGSAEALHILCDSVWVASVWQQTVVNSQTMWKIGVVAVQNCHNVVVLPGTVWLIVFFFSASIFFVLGYKALNWFILLGPVTRTGADWLWKRTNIISNALSWFARKLKLLLLCLHSSPKKAILMMGWKNGHCVSSAENSLQASS